MNPYLINVLQILGIGAIGLLIGALWTRLRLTTVKNVKTHALFVSTALAGLGLAAIVSSRLYIGRSLLDNATWFCALWFFFFFLFWCGFKLFIAGVHQDFGESSMLSMQHLGETRLSTKIGDAPLPTLDAPIPPIETYVNSRGAVVHGERRS
jgi:hypothetical protein